MSAKSPNSWNTDGSKPAPPPAAELHAGVAEAIVEAALLGVGENRVRLGALLEFLFGELVARIAIRVELHRQLAVRALDLGLGRGRA